MDGLVFAVFDPLDRSEAVNVALPAVLNVTLRLCDPATKPAFAGSEALESDEVIPTVSVTFVKTFQFASTALTVTVRAVPAACATGVPVLPVAEPGAALSPGTSNCNFVKVAAPTEIEGEV